MSELVLLGLKGLAGGAFVVLFSLLAKSVQPRMFSGLFAAAPSVAAASLLTVAMLQDQPAVAARSAAGMVAGAVGMSAYCGAALYTMPRLGAWPGTLLPWLAWAVVSFGVYFVFLS